MRTSAAPTNSGERHAPASRPDPTRPLSTSWTVRTLAEAKQAPNADCTVGARSLPVHLRFICRSGSGGGAVSATWTAEELAEMVKSNSDAELTHHIHAVRLSIPKLEARLQTEGAWLAAYEAELARREAGE